MAEAIICPACGFDPYDMIFYAVKQEFPDSNPRDVIEEMSDEEYKEEAEFYVFENHIDYCPNQDKLMKISAGFDTEQEAFAYAYNQGHAASRQRSPYKPNPTDKDTMDFKKIYKQRAESTESKCSWWSGCDEEEEEVTDCEDCGDAFCYSHMCSDCDNCDDCCSCKCFECGSKESYMYQINTGESSCMDCSQRCDNCDERFPNDEVRDNSINYKSYCNDCRSEMGECYICDDVLINYYNDSGSCEVCHESVCSECSQETEDPKKPGFVEYGVACDECVKEKKLVVTAETFKAPYAGAGSLMGIGQGTGLGSFTSKELTESSAIHGDFDSASLNYSGKQNLEVRAEASDSYDNLAHQDEMAQEAYEEYVEELDPETDYPPMSFEEWYEQTMAIYDTPEYEEYLEQQYLLMQMWEDQLELMTLEADWRDLPRDSAGRWTRPTIEEPENLDAYIDIQPAQSGNFPLPVEKQETFSQSQITLRELSETMNELTGNLLGFDMAYRTVVDMLGSQRREALLSTIEETIMTLEFYEETGYDGDIQMMVDMMRQNGMTPPPQFEEEVLARYQFEDKWASETEVACSWCKKPSAKLRDVEYGGSGSICPNCHYSYRKLGYNPHRPQHPFKKKAETEEDFIKWFEDAEGPDCYTCGDYNSLGDVEGQDNICEPCQSLWVYDEGGPEGEGYYRIHTLSWDQKVHFHNAKAEGKKILKPEVPADFNIKATFGNNMVLMAEGLEEDRNSPAFEEWEEKFYLCYHDWQDDELHVDTFDEKYQITAYCSLCDATMLLHIGDNGPEVVELPGRRPLLDFYDTSQEAYAAEEDEGPTIEDFFRDISKVLNKYGEFSWDSEAGKEGLYFSGMLLPHNGADNFFQYDEDFSE